jgi:hypothetical protein
MTYVSFVHLILIYLITVTSCKCIDSTIFFYLASPLTLNRSSSNIFLQTFFSNTVCTSFSLREVFSQLHESADVVVPTF